MKIYSSTIGHPETQQSFAISFSLKNKINLLIFTHLVLFGLYSVAEWMGFLEQPMKDGTMRDFVQACLTISSRTEHLRAYWWSGMLSYQFIHFNLGEFIISMSMLWLFGHMLQHQLGQQKVVLLYFLCVMLSALVFILSHQVFAIFSGYGGIMEGAFGGVLGVMTATLVLYRSQQLRITDKIFIPLWQLYGLVLLASLVLVYKNNMAYVLVYVSSMYAGLRYAVSRLHDSRKVQSQMLTNTPQV